MTHIEDCLVRNVEVSSVQHGTRINMSDEHSMPLSLPYCNLQPRLQCGRRRIQPIRRLCIYISIVCGCVMWSASLRMLAYLNEAQTEISALARIRIFWDTSLNPEVYNRIPSSYYQFLVSQSSTSSSDLIMCFAVQKVLGWHRQGIVLRGSRFRVSEERDGRLRVQKDRNAFYKNGESRLFDISGLRSEIHR